MTNENKSRIIKFLWNLVSVFVVADIQVIKTDTH